MNSEFDLLHYLINVAPVVVVMSVAIFELWRRNNTLIDKIHERDLSNLKTLEQMLMALKHLDEKGSTHFKDLKEHVTDQIALLKRGV